MRPDNVSPTLLSVLRPHSCSRQCAATTVAELASRAAVSVAALSLSALAYGQEVARVPVESRQDVTVQATIPFTGSIVDSNNPRNPHCKALRDINGDGQRDIVVASASGGGMYWYEYPRWTKHAIRASGSWTTDMQTADIDKDGDFDLVIPDAAGIKWYRNPRPAGNPRTGSLWTEFNIGSAGANNHDVETRRHQQGRESRRRDATANEVVRRTSGFRITDLLDARRRQHPRW